MARTRVSTPPPNLQALKVIERMPIRVGPFVQSTTGAIVPFFNDSRCLYSHPRELKVFVAELAKIIRRYQRSGKRIDCIVGVPMAGIPLAAALSLSTGIPFAYLNKERKRSLTKKILEGDYRRGARAVLVDDVVAFGETFTRAIKHCRAEGVVVKHAMNLWNPWWPKNAPFIRTLRRRDITYDALYTRLDWIAHLHRRGIVSADALEIQHAYLTNPIGWHKDKAMWRKFLLLKRRYRKTGRI